MSALKMGSISLNRSSTIWFLVAIGAHAGWGANPVLARYLQTVSNLPTFSILSLGHLLAALIVFALFFRKLKWSQFNHPVLLTMVVFAVMRAVTNLISARYTLAIYVQLINLLTPFAVIALGRLFFTEKIPPYTGRAISAALLGSMLMLSADIAFLPMESGLNQQDRLGIGLALLSTIFLAMYMLLVRKTAQHKIPAEAVLVSQMVALTLVNPILSLIARENWNTWIDNTPQDWGVFGLYVIGVLVGSNLGQVASIRRLGASLVSSLQGTRLLIAFLLAWWLLDEWLTTVWQWLGAIIVIATITWYLSKQYAQQEPVPIS